MRAPVTGGHLELHELAPGDGPLVLALHGITANALSWAPVARAVSGRARVVAPDLRGRACSRSVTRPYGLAAHADDVATVLDHLGIQQAVLAGHSMGAFVAALVAARHPSRVSAVLLVDGGFAFPPPTGVDDDQVLDAVLGPAMERLSMTFSSEADYLDFWAPHPAVGPALEGPAGDAVRAYLLHDLTREGSGALRSSCVVDAVRADGAGVLADDEAHVAAASTDVPVTLLWARRGLMDEDQGLYDPRRLAALDLPPRVRTRLVEGTNHYDVLFAPDAVETVAAELLALIR